MNFSLPESLTCRVCRQRPPPEPRRIRCDVWALRNPDMRVVEGLARMQLAARRKGRRVELARAHSALRELIELAGLAGVLPLRIETCRQAEEREEPLGVEEERDPAEPSA